ncbi:conserved hypothetical protein [Rhodospirillaceae bacterium LM-1]|nr:conserved hypothetical protein [Rhodospirillaceae bacterium LM-1]
MAKHAKKSLAKVQPMPLPDGFGLRYAPVNEMGVVVLFLDWARKRKIRIEQIRPNFPDCIASLHGKEIRIEFELKARSFVSHRHDPKGCDWVVCWENNWSDAPKNLTIISLAEEFGLGFNVWVKSVTGDEISFVKSKDKSWSVPSGARTGDLILYYRKSPDRFIADLFRVTCQPTKQRAGWKPGRDVMASITRVASLKDPIHLEDLQSHRRIKSAGFIRGQLQGGYKATSQWADLYKLILDKNPSARKTLARYSPDKVFG